MHGTCSMLLVLLLTACGPGGKSFRINGSFSDMQAGELFIYNLAGEQARLDTLTIQGGRFFYEGEVEDVTPYMLVFPNGMEQVIFVSPGQEVTYKATANDLKNYVVKGGDENKLMNQFRQETYSAPPAMVVTAARTYIKDNPTSPVAVYLLDRYFVQTDNTSHDELRPLLRLLQKHQPHNHFLMEIENRLSYGQQLAVGKKLPDLQLTRRDRSTSPLWPSQTKAPAFNVVLFWSTWMHNGYETLWQVRRHCNSYKDDERLRFVTVSLDVERYRWEDAIRIDTANVRMEHYCDGLGFESQAVKTLGVHRLPYYIIADQQHKILEKGHDMKSLEDWFKKHLQQ